MAEALHPPVYVKRFQLQYTGHPPPQQCLTNAFNSLTWWSLDTYSLHWLQDHWCLSASLVFSFLMNKHWNRKGCLQQEFPQGGQLSVTCLFLPTFWKPISGFNTHDQTVSLQDSYHISSKHNTFQHFLPLLFKMFRAPNVRHTAQWELSHSW